MSEQQTQAASSPAEVDVFQGKQPTMAEYDSYRQTGELPERFKPAETVADTATADAPEETVEDTESESESETEEAQEPPQKSSPAQKRILQLLAEKKELQRKLEAAAKPDAATPGPSTAQANQQDAQNTRPKPSVDATDKDGKPKYGTYEDYVEDLADWKAEQQVMRFQQAQQQQEALRTLKGKLDDVRTRYSDADSVIMPAAQKLTDAQIPPAIKEIFSQSDHFLDLCYMVGSDPDELNSFISLAQTNPRAALAKVFEYEGRIQASKSGKTDSGTAPEKKQTTAPKPPSPVGGTSSRAFDVSDESLSPEAWAAKRNKQVSKG